MRIMAVRRWRRKSGRPESIDPETRDARSVNSGRSRDDTVMAESAFRVAAAPSLPFEPNAWLPTKSLFFPLAASSAYVTVSSQPSGPIFTLNSGLVELRITELHMHRTILRPLRIRLPQAAHVSSGIEGARERGMLQTHGFCPVHVVIVQQNMPVRCHFVKGQAYFYAFSRN